MPRSVDHELRRSAVCDAVVDIARARGFAAVTFRSVAQDIGASTSAVTHYFRSRDELLSVAVRREVGQRRSELEAAIHGRTGPDAVRAVIDWCVVGAGGAAQRFWLALLVGAATEPVVSAALTEFDASWDELVSGILHAGEGTAEDKTALVDSLGVLVDGLTVSALLPGRELPDARRRQVVDAWLKSLGS